MTEEPDLMATVRALVDYVRFNPLACDTAEGISRWWLGRDPTAIETLQRALDWMTRQLLLEQIPAADGRLRYRRCATDRELSEAAQRVGDASETRH